MDETETLEISVTEKDIEDISDSAASIKIQPSPLTTKRIRQLSLETSMNQTSTQQSPPAKKIKKITMDPPELPDVPKIPPKHMVRLVPDIENVHLFTPAHLEILNKSVLRAHKEYEDPNIKFDYCQPERGRFKFVCPNEDAKNFALKIVPLLKNLWKDPKIKAIDCGEIPKIIKAGVTFKNPPPDMLEFFEDIEKKNETIDTNEWRIYGRKPAVVTRPQYSLEWTKNRCQI